MKRITLTLFLAALQIFAAKSAVAFVGEVNFTNREVRNHDYYLEDILDTARDCLLGHYNHHRDFYNRYGISPYYGQNSAYSRMTYREQVDRMRSLGLSSKLTEQMKPTSCVGLTLECLGKGFKRVRMDKTWNKIVKFTKANGVSGTAIQHGLQKLGWSVLYWNPDTDQNMIWDDQEAQKYVVDRLHFKGYHEERYNTLLRTNKYLYNRVDRGNDFVDFGTRIPRRLYDVPFFVGTAHAGYHVFPGFNQWIIEGHSTRRITDRQTIEASQFNPLETGGGPRGLYRSGLIAIPPGY
jgi:hypothetical protein